MATYKRPQSLPIAIQSILDQTVDNFELIVIDNYGDVNFNQQIFKDSKNRIRTFTYTKETGSCVARNFGLKRCTGEYVCVVDDDDIALPHYIQTFYEGFKKYPKAVMIRANMDGWVGGLINDTYAGPIVWTKRELAQSVKWDAKYGYNGDQNYYWSILAKYNLSEGNGKVIHIDKVVYKVGHSKTGGIREGKL